MSPRYTAVLLSLAISPCLHAQLPAFPGAEGFGSISNGGRGGDIYYVTNLNTSGAGSFAEGVSTAPTAGRTILFKVSGHIRLSSTLNVSKSKITIAGQTAPGDGICIWNKATNFTGNDLVIRNLRFRYGKQIAGGDAVDIGKSQRIILDHCDVMFSTDENLSSFGTPPEFFTFQWSVNAWGLSSHSCGGLWDINHATAHHTLWANNHTRNPKCISPSVFDWVNNVTFGWDNGFNMAAGSDPISRVNIRGSYFIHGANTTEAVYGGGLNTAGENIFQLHMSDSALDGTKNGVLDANRTNYGMVNSSSYDQVATPWPQTVDGITGGPVIGTPVTFDSRRTAHKKVLSQAGATRMEISSRSLRDEITQLCVDRTALMQRGIISDPLELNLSTGTAFADLKSTTAPTDTDRDGIPDDWEDAVGYNKTIANHNTVLTAPQTAASFFPAGSPIGYTQLEEYLHFKAVPHGTVGKNTAAAPSFIEIDLRKFTSGFTTLPAFTVSNITGGSLTQSGFGNAIVRFSPTQDFSGRAGFLFTVTDSVGDTWTQQCALLVSTKPQPRPITWIGDATTNNWDTTTPNFSSNLGTTAFANTDAVTINDSGSNTPTIQVTGALSPDSLIVNNSTKNFTLQGSGSLTASGDFTKTGTGTLTFSNTGPNAFLSAAMEAGTLSLTTANALGTAPITCAGGTLAFSVDLSNPLIIDGTVALNPSGGRNVNGSWSGSGTLQINNTGSNLLSLIGGMANFSGNVDFGTSTGSARLYGNLGSASASFDLGTGSFTLYSRNGGSSFQLGSLSGGPNTVLSGTSSIDVNTTYNIGALDTSTTFDGRITNGSRAATTTSLTKTGSGTLTLTGNSTHSGATNINSGSLALLGNFTNSPVSVAANATLTGTGTIGSSLTTAAGAILSPGAENGSSIGTLTAASLNLVSPTLRFDLPSSSASSYDRIQSSGAMTLNGPQNFIFNLTEGSLTPGSYDLITTTGTLTATGVTLTSNLPADSRQTFTLEQSPSGTAPGYIRLVVTGNAGSLTWTGSNGGKWDRETTVAWSGASPATFYNFDAVSFTDTATSGSVTLTQPVSPRSISVTNTAARPYTFTGAPITGPASLVKSGSGTLTLTVPQYTLANCSITTGSPTVTVSSTANLFPGMTVLDSTVPTSIPTGTTILSIVNASTLTLSQNATATSTTDSLIFETRNTFSGGTVLNEGSLTLLCNSWQYYSSAYPSPSNAFGLGTGPITLNGGTLTLLGHTVDTRYLSGSLPNDLIVPAGKSATLKSVMRGTYLGDIAGLRGNLTGSGTLNLVVNYAYSAITGDWSAFSGTLNVSRPTSGANDPRFQLGNPLGLPLATTNLDQVTLSYAATPPSEGITIPIGSLSGISTSIIAGGESSTPPVTWQVGALNNSTTFAGNFTPYSAGGPIGLEKTGSGTWTLTGTGTVNAGITVAQGTLSYGDAASDTLSGTSEISVNPAATLQLNSGAKIVGASCEIFSGGTLRGFGTLQAPLFSSGTLAISGGTLTIIGNTSLTGSVEFSSFSDRLAITGNLSLEGSIKLPATGLSSGRKVLATYSGTLSLGDLSVTNVPSTYLAILDPSIPGEIAVDLIDQAAWQTWQTEKFASTTSPESQLSADPDNDGMTNLEEFQAGTDPNLDTSFVPLVWQGGTANSWDLATTANWLENSTLRVFRDKRHVSITDTGSNSPAITLTGTLQPGSLTVSNSSKAFTISGEGSISGTSGLTKSGTNTLTIASTNSFSGPTSITAGVVNIQNATALGTAENGTTVANNARLELQGDITVAGEPLTLSGQGGTAFYNGSLSSKSGYNTWTGPVTLAATGTRIGAQAAATLAISGQISSAPDTTGLTVRCTDMTSTVILSGPNTYAGETTIVGGILKLGASNTLPAATSLRLGLSNVSGKFDLAGFNQEISGFSAISGTANEITSATPATLTINTTTDSSIPAPVTGNAALTKSGPAILTVSSPHTYTGPTTVNAGKLLLNLSALATPSDLLNPISPLTLGGSLELKGKPAAASSQSLGNLTIPAAASATIALTPNGASSTNLTLGDTWNLGTGATLLIDLSAGNCSLTSNPTLTGWLLPGVTVKDASGITGPATVVAGKIVRYIPPALAQDTNDATREFSSLNSIFTNSILDWTHGGLLTTRAVHRLILDSSLTGGTIDMGIATNILTLTSGEIQFFATNDLTLTGGQVGAAGAAISLTTSGTNTLTLSSPISSGAGNLAITGTANVILNSANTFTGGITLNGGTLKQGVTGALGSANGSLTLNSGSLDLNGIATGLGILTGTGGSLVNSSLTTATLTLGNNNATGGNFAGSLTGNIALTKTGTGTQILSGNNPYTGLTTVSAGILRASADHAIGNGNLTLNGGTLDLQSFSDAVGAVTLTSGTLTGTSGLLIASSYSLTSGTLSASIGGASATLAKSGSSYTNTATLSGTNSYGGTTTLGTNSGTLTLSHSSSLGGSPSVTLTGTGTALRLADVTITGIPITLRGSGANNGSAGNFSGSLTTADNANATWTGSITLGDSNVRLGTGNNGSLNITGPILGSVASPSIFISSGSGSNLGTTILSGANDFPGNVNILRGNLKLGNTNTLPATAMLDVAASTGNNVSDNTTFDLNGFSQSLAGLKRTSTNTTQVSTVTNSSTTASTLTLNHSSDLTFSGRVTGNLSLVKSGSGKFTLSGTTHTFSGNTTLSGGSLSIAAPILPDAASVSISSGAKLILAFASTTPDTIATLTLGGTQVPAGTYNISHPSYGSFFSGTGSLTVTSGPAFTPFESWMNTFPSLTTAQKLPSADPDADGINNLLEYVLNGTPTIANPSILPATSLTATHAIFTFTRREESTATTTQTFEYSSNLSTWTSVNLTSTIGPEVTLGEVSNGSRSVTVTLPRPTPNENLFGRLKVTQP